MNYESRMTGDSAYLIEGEVASKRRKWIIVGAVVVALVVVVAAIMVMRGGSDGAAAKTGAVGAKGAQQVPVVSVMVPGRSAVATIVTGTGTIAARREMPVGIAGEGGMVTRVLVEPGSWVKAGQVLATIDRSVQTQTAESQAASIRVAQADADLAKAELDRARQLVDRGFISKADVQRREATLAQTTARVRVAQAQLAETRARNGRLDIRSPAEGLVLTRGVEPGQIVSAGNGMLFRVAMGGQMEMRAQLAETDLARVHTGVQAQVTPVGATQGFTGQVWQVSPIIDPQSRQGIARIALSYSPALRPGGFASASINVGGSQAPLLPESAVLSDGKGNFVYIVDGANKAVRRDVRVGEVSDAGVSIAGGLDGTERVVLSAGAFLNPGQTVKPELKKAR
ncbi:efflux RND transporter periplasmic adaptor subunit [Sphingomonas donggukensis]|uniref:Efflux RND transporter periplasmic adaptor subunit n=1 Tax=Sphingomonas donggukensis TaxID=2949093 RepID=A0ABY4TSC8_9SPHN|nr:efflux RND transporter periplasmic adaptor subunit [Sphingomonas donggukensis]URW75315.1 efflux RND transporter periplasmic adaptor subunit [Sphingomonas donggukensis]